MRQDRNLGFTLVELITSITIIGILSTIVVAFGVNGLANYSFSYNRGVLLDQAHIGLQNVSESILQAASVGGTNTVEDPNGPGGPSELFGWQSDEDTLVLATAAENNNNNIIFQDEAQYTSYKNNVVYYLDGTLLKRRILAVDVADNKATTTCPQATESCPKDATIMEGVKDFDVSYFNSQNQEVSPNNARSIGLKVTLFKEAQGRDITINYQTRTVFRND